MRILVVEDEPKMGELIRRVLVSERHVADIAPDGVGALALAAGEPYDVIVLDRMLPDMDGVEVLRLLRARGVATPVLMLTALDAVEHRVAGLDAGADDYLAKPFAFAELLARLRALGRRSVVPEGERLAAGDIELDELRHVARVGDAAVELSAREFALLAYFVRHAGRGAQPPADPRRGLGSRAGRLFERRGLVRPLPASQARRRGAPRRNSYGARRGLCASAGGLNARDGSRPPAAFRPSAAAVGRRRSRPTGRPRRESGSSGRRVGASPQSPGPRRGAGRGRRHDHRRRRHPGARGERRPRPRGDRAVGGGAAGGRDTRGRRRGG